MPNIKSSIKEHTETSRGKERANDEYQHQQKEIRIKLTLKTAINIKFMQHVSATGRRVYDSRTGTHPLIAIRPLSDTMTLDGRSYPDLQSLSFSYCDTVCLFFDVGFCVFFRADVIWGLSCYYSQISLAAEVSLFPRVLLVSHAYSVALLSDVHDLRNIDVFLDVRTELLEAEQTYGHTEHSRPQTYLSPEAFFGTHTNHVSLALSHSSLLRRFLT